MTALDPAWTREFEDRVVPRIARLARLARLLVDDPAAADDLVQTVLVKVLSSWPRARHADDLDAYLRRALVNARTSRWSRHRREARVEAVTDAGARAVWGGGEAAVPDPADDVARRHHLAAALRRLPAGQRTAVVLRYYADLDERQVADAMRCSVGTVRSQTARGVRRLRDILGAPAATGHDTGRAGRRKAVST